MKIFRNYAFLLAAALMLALSVCSCGHKDESAEFINALKEASVKSENIDNAIQAIGLAHELDSITNAYTASTAPFTDEQKAMVVDFMTTMVKNVAPLSMQQMSNPEFVNDYAEKFREALTSDLSDLDNLGEVSTYLNENL